MSVLKRSTHTDRPRFLWVVTIGVLIWLFLPIVVVVMFSFNGQKSLSVMSGLSTQWYEALFSDGDLLASLQLSLLVAVVSTVLSTLLGTLLAFGLQRGHRSVASAGNASIVLRLVSPETAVAVALLLLFTQLGITLSTTTLVISHVALCTAFVTVVVQSRLSAISEEIEDAAMDLGARPSAAVRLVTIPLLTPAIAAGGLLAFVLSFDNFVTSYFTSGIGVSPLPVRIYSMIRFGVSPEINAVGVLMMLITTLAIVAGLALPWLLRSRNRWSEAVAA